MIIANNVTKKFGKLKALDDFTVKCMSGACISLIGPNGSGKTTFIKSILGMVIPDSGFITFNNHNISKDCTYRNEIGYMPQIGRYPDNMSIGQVLDMMKDIRASYGNTSLDEDLVNAFQLEALKDKKMRTLSGGTRQKVSAALAFLFNPSVLILDEPTAGLDPVATEVLKEKINQEKAKGKLILVTSHVLSDLDDLVNEVIFMQDGKLIFHKTIDILKQDTGEDKLGKAIASVMTHNK
jgi:Cu-processing system ATP-binding protein